MVKKAIWALPAILVLAGMVFADWDVGDTYKMHFPQLPDEAGWDVKASDAGVIADDWLCTETGPVTDIHFWGSWYNGQPGDILGFSVSIFSDVPDPDPTNPQDFSHPGALLWTHYFPIDEVRIRQIVPIPQVWEGWYEPSTGVALYPNHDNYYQYNIVNIQNAMVQEAGMVYWLSVQADVVPSGTPAYWGWKSSTRHYSDKAVYQPGGGTVCTAPDNGTGTVDFPVDCPLVSTDHYLIQEGLPQGSTIELDGPMTDFACTPTGICSVPMPGGVCEMPGGTLGGTVVCFQGAFQWQLTGTGMLAGWTRYVTLPVELEVHHGPRIPGSTPQAFPSQLFRLLGQIVGDPDFDLLRITSGADFGLPSGGNTVLTQLPGGNWQIDSFFDITYRIDFVGSPSGPLAGMSGSTVGTIRVHTGASDHEWMPMDEPMVSYPISNPWNIFIDPAGNFAGGGGGGAYGAGWYLYPEYGWLNIWFYDHPLDLARYKVITIEFDAFPFTDGPSMLEVAVNWSTIGWSVDGNPPGERRPPLPGEGPENEWIGRQLVFASPQFSGHYGPFEVIVPQFNPEWVSVDVRGFNFAIPNGTIVHECLAQAQEPVDLAFVITGNAESCCLLRGDVDHSGVGPDISDLVYLVTYMFGGGPLPPCEEPVGSGYFPECDVNGDSTGPDIADLVYLVTYMFGGGPAPVPCP